MSGAYHNLDVYGGRYTILQFMEMVRGTRVEQLLQAAAGSQKQ